MQFEVVRVLGLIQRPRWQRLAPVGEIKTRLPGRV